MIKADINTSLHNKFEFKLIDKNDNVKQEAVAYNTVTNNYYNRINTVEELKFRYIALGTGTGTPAVTNTSMFSMLQSKDMGLNSLEIEFMSTNNFKLSKTITFTESEAIGNLTEVGIHGNYYTESNILLYTHAMITDAEGHVITINKTDTDRLLITITLYLELTLPNSVLPFYGIGDNNFTYYGDQKTNRIPPDDASNASVRPTIAYLMGTGSRWFDTLWNGCIRIAVSPGGVSYHSGGPMMSVSCVNTSTGVRVQSTSRVLSEDGNLAGTYQLYGFSTPIGYIPITSNIFPPITLELTQVADGTSKGFNFKIPELLSEGLEVYINDTLQSASTYTWNGIDYVSSFQAWETTRADKVSVNPTATWSYKFVGGNWSSSIFNNWFSMGQGVTWSTDKMVFDYGTQKTFTRAYKPNAGSAYADWEYSNDGQNWTTITIPSSDKTIYDFPTPISARYLRVNSSNQSGWSDYWTPNISMLCCYKDQLVFNTAPAAGAVVKIKAKSAYPIKNSNWILDQFVLDFTISRGT